MAASPKRQAVGISSPPPQARPPQTGGPLMAQPTARQQQRQQYLQNHPNARGNQPPSAPPPPPPPQRQPMRPIPPQGGGLGGYLGGMAQGQGGWGGANGPAQIDPGQQMPMGQNPFGGQMQTMEYRFPKGQVPPLQYQNGLQGYADARGAALGQEQQSQGWQNPQMQNMNWAKVRGGY